jgi:hypothetical protein
MVPAEWPAWASRPASQVRHQKEYRPAAARVGSLSGAVGGRDGRAAAARRGGWGGRRKGFEKWRLRVSRAQREPWAVHAGGALGGERQREGRGGGGERERLARRWGGGPVGWGGVGDGPQHGGWAGQASPAPRHAPAAGQASPASGQAQRPAQRRAQASPALRPAPRPRMLPRGGRRKTPAAACAAAARAPARRRRVARRGRGQSGTRRHGWAAGRRR